ncbi:hypothetical protein BS50DRAFT_623600 [Corynespora cassiicola Philippines]|uniref:Rhodopsin domain-containing protein n=1 Tax=Corynespora cassiicola Philippines TaxID=1448308 RepID=A0A2T2NFW4_CORCC|nr:hypothetical protein BS50DRAFT_623600 [Corynespora cassiicola Philippines]
MDSSILSQVNTTAVTNALTPELEAETQWRAENSGRIKMREYQIVVGILFGTATLTCAGRILIRLYTRRKLFLDDIFLILGFFSLIGGTILLKQVPVFYLVLATLQGDFWATVLSFKKINDVIKQWDYIYAYFVFLWTSIYAVKGCYFAFFAQFRRTMTRTFNWYYWIAVGFSVVCWIWSCVALTIACPYFGDGALKCFPDLPISKRIVRLLFWLYPILDGISDLMIISIPILILKQSQLRLITKIGLCAFLCLSIFMIACSITRAAGSYHKGALDYVWQLFWLHTEACIGVSMGSITVYRSTLIGSNEVSDRLQSYLNRIFGRDLESGDGTTISPNGERTRRRRRFLGTIKLPGATLTGLRTKFGPSKEQVIWDYWKQTTMHT